MLVYAVAVLVIIRVVAHETEGGELVEESVERLIDKFVIQLLTACSRRSLRREVDCEACRTSVNGLSSGGSGKSGIHRLRMSCCIGKPGIHRPGRR